MPKSGALFDCSCPLQCSWCQKKTAQGDCSVYALETQDGFSASACSCTPKLTEPLNSAEPHKRRQILAQSQPGLVAHSERTLDTQAAGPDEAYMARKATIKQWQKDFLDGKRQHPNATRDQIELATRGCYWTGQKVPLGFTQEGFYHFILVHTFGTNVTTNALKSQQATVHYYQCFVSDIFSHRL